MYSDGAPIRIRLLIMSPAKELLAGVFAWNHPERQQSIVSDELPDES
jgi:hypothetical protein